MTASQFWRACRIFRIATKNFRASVISCFDWWSVITSIRKKVDCRYCYISQQHESGNSSSDMFHSSLVENQSLCCFRMADRSHLKHGLTWACAPQTRQCAVVHVAGGVRYLKPDTWSKWWKMCQSCWNVEWLTRIAGRRRQIYYKTNISPRPRIIDKRLRICGSACKSFEAATPHRPDSSHI